ncbi:MAG TPA: HAMP domain-containing sensor histidine kinase [Actinomycetota bacterium]|nr:HAMP domain-containing sensor histidine kinase [Actinomycetota bacterium]
MSFRNRLILSAALAVAIAVALSSVIVYFAVRRQLLDQVDTALLQRAEYLQSIQGSHYVRPPLGAAGGYAQIVTSNGGVMRDSNESIMLPAPDQARLVAAGQADTFFSDMRVSGTRVRVITAPLTQGLAVMVVRPLDEVDLILKRLGLLLSLIAACGVALAAGLGRMVAQAALVPVQRLTQGAERVAETRSPAHRIEAGGNDEIGRLASSFNSMLEALDDSQKSQRQLVADASHELRTPLTSLRTNIEVLARADELPEQERRELLSDLKVQIQELTVLVGDLTDLARGDEPEAGEEEIRLDHLVERAVQRIRTHWTQVNFVTELNPTLVRGAPSRLDRAVANLLDNAGKWSPPSATVEVKVQGGTVMVRDYGPGIDPADLPHIFDRFYRASEARAMPGSGLGLSIVRRIAEAHGGKVTAEQAPGGGSVFRLTLPALPFSPPPGELVSKETG